MALTKNNEWIYNLRPSRKPSKSNCKKFMEYSCHAADDNQFLINQSSDMKYQAMFITHESLWLGE